MDGPISWLISEFYPICGATSMMAYWAIKCFSDFNYTELKKPSYEEENHDRTSQRGEVTVLLNFH